MACLSEPDELLTINSCHDRAGGSLSLSLSVSLPRSPNKKYVVVASSPRKRQASRSVARVFVASRRGVVACLKPRHLHSSRSRPQTFVRSETRSKRLSSLSRFLSQIVPDKSGEETGRERERREPPRPHFFLYVVKRVTTRIALASPSTRFSRDRRERDTAKNP